MEERFLPLVQAHPGVDLAIGVATRRWRRAPLAHTTRDEIGRARREIAAFAPDVALDPQGLVKSAFWARFAAVPRRIGFAAGHRREHLAGLFYSEVAAPPAGLSHVIDHNLALLAPLHLPAAPGAIPDGRFLLADRGGDGTRESRTVALLPAAGKPHKCWHHSNYAALARRLAEGGWRPLVVVGPTEEPLGREVVAAAEGSAELAPPTTIPALARLLGGCRAVVGGDTGPVHLAASLGTPTLAIYLSTDAERNSPRGARVNVVTAARAGARYGRARTGPAGEVGTAAVMAALDGMLD